MSKKERKPKADTKQDSAAKKEYKAPELKKHGELHKMGVGSNIC